MKYETIQKYSRTKFRRSTGVKRKTFEKMGEILKKFYAEKHRRRGKKPKLCICVDGQTGQILYLAEKHDFQLSNAP